MMSRLSTVSLVLALLAPSLACGGGRVLSEEEIVWQENRAEPPERTPIDDAYSRHGGEVVPPGEPFRLGNEPKGVADVRAVIALVKMQWSVMELPSGEEARSGTATVEVKRGEEAKTVRLDEQEAKTVLGVRLEAGRGGEDYVEEAARWLPWLDLTVSEAP